MTSSNDWLWQWCGRTHISTREGVAETEPRAITLPGGSTRQPAVCWAKVFVHSSHIQAVKIQKAEQKPLCHVGALTWGIGRTNWFGHSVVQLMSPFQIYLSDGRACITWWKMLLNLTSFNLSCLSLLSTLLQVGFEAVIPASWVRSWLALF